MPHVVSQPLMHVLQADQPCPAVLLVVVIHCAHPHILHTCISNIGQVCASNLCNSCTVLHVLLVLKYNETCLKDHLYRRTTCL